MREIVFRGKDRFGGWHEGFYAKSADEYSIEVWDSIRQEMVYTPVIPDTVGQYTGLIDKNGNKIFEGDVLETFEHGQIRQLWIVSFKEGCFVATLYDSFICKEFTKIAFEQIEVIGNIHDKPELVPQGKEQPAAGVNICDRCGRVMNNAWKIPGMPGVGGNCAYCGDDLCAECAGTWSENGECERCAVPY